jgi:RNA polymerase sigma-70 factor (ECF subfamily)
MSEFEKIYSEYFTDIYKYTLSLCHNETVAEDITQETFLKAIENIKNFKGDCKLKVWLCQIAKNTYFSYHKKNKKISEYNIELTDDSFELKLIDKDTAFGIHKMLHNLDEPYKEVFSLRIFSELSFAQIGELFKKTESWARVTFHRAKIKLKEKIE